MQALASIIVVHNSLVCSYMPHSGIIGNMLNVYSNRHAAGLALQSLYSVINYADNIPGRFTTILILNCKSMLIHKFNENMSL